MTGILLTMARPLYRIGDVVEWEIDCIIRPGVKTILRGFGEVVRHARGGFIAIQFDTDGAAIVRSATGGGIPTLEAAAL
jgi:hypothetical protein